MKPAPFVFLFVVFLASACAPQEAAQSPAENSAAVNDVTQIEYVMATYGADYGCYGRMQNIVGTCDDADLAAAKSDAASVANARRTMADQQGNFGSIDSSVSIGARNKIVTTAERSVSQVFWIDNNVSFPGASVTPGHMTRFFDGTESYYAQKYVSIGAIAGKADPRVGVEAAIRVHRALCNEPGFSLSTEEKTLWNNLVPVNLSSAMQQTDTLYRKTLGSKCPPAPGIETSVGSC